jgi:reductive dehalogenase
MNRFHSTVSRRNFMKGLGLGMAGLGAAAATGPVFHDMDELIASEAVRKTPWWETAREINNPTVDVDWGLKERYNKANFEGVTPEEAERRVQIQIQAIKDNWNQPGMTHRDYAYMSGARGNALSIKRPLNGSDLSTNLHYTNSGSTKPGGYSYTDLGLPRHSGTPEENLRMMAAALHSWGAGRVGAFEVNSTSLKTFYSYDSRGRAYGFGDTEFAYSDDNNACVIPNSAKYVVTWIVPQSHSNKFSAPVGTNIMSKSSMAIGYSHQAIMQNRALAMVAALGYKAVSNACGGNNVACGILAGNGEHGRFDYLVDPKFGGLVRLSDFILTDLPLAATPPMDAGIWNFCQTCKKCATVCPAAAISQENEPTWEIENPGSNGLGLNSYHVNYVKCHPYRGHPGAISQGGCGQCQSVCVFGKQSQAAIHQVVAATIGTTPIFNGFFRNMDDMFGYGEMLNADDWWDEMADKIGAFIPSGWQD